MRRVIVRSALIMKTSLTSAAVSAAAGQQQERLRSHSHGGGGHHHHSHGSIEKDIQGKNLRACQMATAAGGATNVIFSVTKIWLGSSGGSVALVADGFHALTDIVADIVSYASISFAQKPFPRCRYPFGIGRLETSGAVLVAAILFFGGIALLVQSVHQCVEDATKLTAVALVGVSPAVPAFLRVGAEDVASDPHTHGDGHAHAESSHGSEDAGSSHGHSHGAHGHSHFQMTEYDSQTGQQMVMWSMVMLAAVSVVCKELLFQWTKRVGVRAGSRVVIANAYHHRADAWSGGVALIGVLGQFFSLPGIDGVAGLVVSASICRIGYGLFRDSIMEFFDYQNAEEVAQVRSKLQDFHPRMSEITKAVVTDTGDSNNQSLTLVSTSKIRFINVFLMRHGHSYALHVTLLVSELWTAKQIQEAVDMLSTLAKTSLPVRDTFISLLPCSSETVPRKAFLGLSREATETRHESTTEAAADHHRSGEEKDEAHEHHYHHACGGEEPSCHTTGAIVNPSLEKCLGALTEFHGFVEPIVYDWNEKSLTVPFALKDCSECARDVESLSIIFKLRVVETRHG